MIIILSHIIAAIGTNKLLQYSYRSKCCPLSVHFIAILWKPDTVLTLIEVASGQERDSYI